MKNVLLTSAIFIVLLSCESPREYNYYGEQIATDQAISINALASQLQDKDSAVIKFEGVIVETCEKKGCWMTAKTKDGSDMRITFKDYGFFVPKEGAEGKSFVAEGVAKRTVTDVETLKHFAEDAGKSEKEIAAITEPKEEITFVATGVAIESTQE